MFIPRYRIKTLLLIVPVLVAHWVNQVMKNLRAVGVARRWSSPLQRGPRCSSLRHHLALAMARRWRPPRLRDEGGLSANLYLFFLFFFFGFNIVCVNVL